MDLSKRWLVPEKMDEPGLSPREHLQALRGLRTINWISRTHAAVHRGLIRIVEASRKSKTTRNAAEPLHVLDIACGGGDLTRQLAKNWDSTPLLPVKWYGWDLSETAIQSARQSAARDNVNVDYTVHNAIQDPFLRDDGGRFDIIFCTLFLHHLETETAVDLLRKLNEQSSLGFMVDDLTRGRFSLVMTIVGCHLLSRSRIVHFDGPQSVRAAFTQPELELMAKKAGVEHFSITTHWPQRMQLIGRQQL